MIRFLLSLFGFDRRPQRRIDGKPDNRHTRSATGDVLAKGRNPAASGADSARPASGAADFDPYNTGKFDRSASWERVRRSHR